MFRDLRPRLILFVTLAGAAHAQRLPLREYTERDGLPSSKVLDVRTSPSGRPWFATRSGVFEFDGADWHPVLVEKLARGRAVRSVLFDDRGDPWLLCSDGRILSSSPRQPRPPVPFPLGPSSGQLLDFALSPGPGDPRAAVVTSRQGLLLLADGEWTTPDLGGAERAAVTAETCFGQLHIGTEQGLVVLGPDGRRAQPPWLEQLPAGPVRGLGAMDAPDGAALWVFGPGWIRIVDARGNLESYADGLPTLEPAGACPVAIAGDRIQGALFGNLWATYHVDARTRKARRLDERSGLGLVGINALARGPAGTLWGASSLGAFQLRHADVEIRDARHGLLEDEVTAVAELPDGRMVLGHDAGLSLIAADSVQRIAFQDADPDLPAFARVMDLCVDAAGTLRVAAAGLGLGTLGADGTMGWIRIPEEHGGWANAVVAGEGDSLLVGTTQALLRLVDGRFEVLGEDGGLDEPFVRRVVRTRSGGILLATITGMWVGEGGTWRNLRSDGQTLGFNHFFTCLEDSRGNLWCGADDGLWRLDGDSIVRAGAAHDPQRPVYSLAEDDRGRLWIGTDYGFFLSDGERLAPLGWLAEHSGYETNRAAAFTDSRGDVWLGTTEAVATFPRSFEAATGAPRVEILELRSSAGSVAPVDLAELAADRSGISVRARAAILPPTDRLEFRYRTSEHAPWITVVGPPLLETPYLPLAPGRHRIELQARVPGGEFGPLASSPPIHVAGPLWSRAWFLGSLLLATALFTALALRTVFLRRHRDVLEREVTKRSAELEETLRELSKTDRLRSLGVLAGGIAHDLRNILTVLVGNQSLLRERDGTSGQEGILASSEAALERATQLSQQLQTFATGGKPLIQPVSVQDILRESAQLVLAGAPVRLDVRIDGDLEPVDADPAQIRQVFENLLLNARQCQLDGGWVELRAEGVTVAEHGAGGIAAGTDLAPGRYVAFTIRDGGPGIPDDVAAQMFDPFYTTKACGSGLGLATARSIVNAHGGALTFETSPDGGTTFRFMLRAAAREPATRPPADVPPTGFPPGRILVVDDEPEVREVLCSMLAHLGLDPVAAGGEREALAAAQRAHVEGRPFDLAIVDLTLPGDSSGPVILERLREIDPTLRGVASSGYSSDAVLARHTEFGFQAALPKPYRLADLRQILNELVPGAGALSGETT